MKALGLKDRPSVRRWRGVDICDLPASQSLRCEHAGIGSELRYDTPTRDAATDVGLTVLLDNGENQQETTDSRTAALKQVPQRWVPRDATVPPNSVERPPPEIAIATREASCHQVNNPSHISFRYFTAPDCRGEKVRLHI
jgi:hypothetical protein